MRLFVALEVPARVREVLAAAVAPHRDDRRVTWTRPEGWHVTLAFVGEVTGQDEDGGPVAAVRAPVVEGCRAAGLSGPIELAAGATTVLGGRVLAVEVADDPQGAVVALGASIQTALQDAGLPVRPRRVRPHLTLARARRRAQVPGGLGDRVGAPEVAWTVDTVHVVESVLGRGPATYVQRAAVTW